MNNIIKLNYKHLFLSIVFLFVVGILNAQEKQEQKDNEIKSVINSRDFVFVAQSANPLGGRFINLTSLYDLEISGDTLNSNLPYFGRSYVAPMNLTESPLRFTSTDFSYTVNPRKKGGWDIIDIP